MSTDERCSTGMSDHQSTEIVSRLRSYETGDATLIQLLGAAADEVERLERARHAFYLEQLRLLEQLGKPAHEREPPHCSTCSCGAVDAPAKCEHKNTSPGADYNEWCDDCGGMLPRSSGPRTSEP